jgi:hypothetical protein
MLPLGCIPRWGREGHPRSLFKKNGELQDFYRAKIILIFEHHMIPQ